MNYFLYWFRKITVGMLFIEDPKYFSERTLNVLTIAKTAF